MTNSTLKLSKSFMFALLLPLLFVTLIFISFFFIFYYILFRLQVLDRQFLVIHDGDTRGGGGQPQQGEREEEEEQRPGTGGGGGAGQGHHCQRGAGGKGGQETFHKTRSQKIRLNNMLIFIIYVFKLNFA